MVESREIAQRLLAIIRRDIDAFGYARYNAVRAELESDFGERAIVYKRGRRNIAPDVLQEFNALPGWERLEWQAPRQRWVEADGTI